MTQKTLLAATAASMTLLVAGCFHVSDSISEDINIRPSFLIGNVSHASFDGSGNDLLTGGLGKTGLLAATAPAFADPLNPTATELRTRAIYNNYRALVDANKSSGGYGTLYGPNVDSNGNVTTGEGKIAGDEYLAYSDDGSGRLNVTMMVQIPATFDANNACIVTATSSGSRGVYGAIGTAGEWGLKKGCAVAYVDKGSGNGVHDLQANTVNLLDGTRADAAAAGTQSQFTANLSASERAAFNAATPNRFAVKHAHSQVNPERDWGTNTLQTVKFAFYLLNQKYAPLSSDGVNHIRQLKPGNTIVVASSVSNGGGAAIAAAEQDTEGLISGVAAGEPQVQLAPNPALVIKRGGNVVASNSRSLIDYFTIANLYQPCAALSSSLTAAPGLFLLNTARATNRCTGLQAKGLLTSTTLAGQADEALAKLHAAGWETESDLFQASHYVLAVLPVALTYANTYAKTSVKDNLCGFSFGATSATGTPTAIAAASIAQIFASGNGVPPTGGINVINNNSVGGPLLDGASVSPSTGVADLNLDGALCLRGLATGTDPATGAAVPMAATVQASVAQARRSGNLRGKPVIIVQGRTDTLLPVNHTGRAYFGNNKIVEGSASRLSYIEVTNAQHFDAFIDNAAVPGYDSRLVPLHRYVIQALDLVYANLKSGAALPPSQVVRTLPRGGTPGLAPALTAANVPAIAMAPAAGDTITFSANTVNVPD